MPSYRQRPAAPALPSSQLASWVAVVRFVYRPADMGRRVAVPDLPSSIHPIISATAGFRTGFLPSQPGDPRARRLGWLCLGHPRRCGNLVSGQPAALDERCLFPWILLFFLFPVCEAGKGTSRCYYCIETLNTSNAWVGFENSLTIAPLVSKRPFAAGGNSTRQASRETGIYSRKASADCKAHGVARVKHRTCAAEARGHSHLSPRVCVLHGS